MQYILAHDLGTSANKATLFTVEGQFVRTASFPYPTEHPHDNWAEQNPAHWWEAFCRCNHVLLAGLNPADVAVVSFDGTYPNCLCIDEAGNALYPAILWQDSRAAEEAEELSSLLPPAFFAGRSSNRVSANVTLSMLWWIKKHRPDVFACTHKILACVSHFVLYRLTGSAVSDYAVGRSTMMSTDEGRTWNQALLDITGIPTSILPVLYPSTHVAGRVPLSLAEECGLAPGTPLVIGTGDGEASGIGVGMLEPGDAYMLGGTSAGILVKRRPGGKNAGGATASSGASLSWLKNQVCKIEQYLAAEEGRDVYELIEEGVNKAPVGSGGVFFHPYLTGERAPRHNPDTKGSFVGITLNTTREDLLRSVVEGIGFNINLIKEQVIESGYPINSLILVGGLSKEAGIRQIFSDIMGIPLKIPAYADEAATMGAAVLGGIGIGLYEDERAIYRFLEIQTIVTPNEENHKKYQKLMPVFEAIYQALVPVYPCL